MKKQLTFLVMISLTTALFAQSDYTAFYSKSIATNTAGMYVLGSWAIANIGGGAIGWSKTSGSTMYFHQMNLFWNSINLAIAGTALIGNFSQDISALTDYELLQKHVKTENLFLLNAGLDFAYIGSGLLLKHRSTKSSTRQNMLAGYGNSVMLQGAFLLIFDAVMWGIQHNRRIQFLEGIEMSLAPAGMSLSYIF